MCVHVPEGGFEGAQSQALVVPRDRQWALGGLAGCLDQMSYGGPFQPETFSDSVKESRLF